MLLCSMIHRCTLHFLKFKQIRPEKLYLIRAISAIALPYLLYSFVLVVTVIKLVRKHCPAGLVLHILLASSVLFC